MPWLQTEPDFGNEQVLLPSSGYSRAVGGAERPHVPVRVGHARHNFPFPPNAKGKPPTRTGCRRRGTGNRPEGVAGPFRQHVVRRTDPALDKWTSTQPWVVRQRKGPCVNRRESVSFPPVRSEEHTSELQSRVDLVCRLLLEKKKKSRQAIHSIKCKKRPEARHRRQLVQQKPQSSIKNNTRTSQQYTRSGPRTTLR